MLVRRVALTLLSVVMIAACGGGSDDATPDTTARSSPSSRAATTTTTSSTTSTSSTSSTSSTTSTAPPSISPTASTTSIASTTPGGTGPPPPTATTAPPPPTTSPAPPYESSITTVTAADLHASWHDGCPLGVDQLRAVDVSHFGNDGAVRTGRLIVAADRALQIVDIFRELYAARFPIARMDPIDVFGGDDDLSMAANNTSAFNCRLVTGGSSWSEHSYGRAIDINPLVNPYVSGSTVLPPQGALYANRTRSDPGMIHAGDVVVSAFAARGWKWGGYWSSPKDYQHFSTTGR